MWHLGFPPDVKWDRAGPHGLHRNLSIRIRNVNLLEPVGA